MAKLKTIKELENHYIEDNGYGKALIGVLGVIDERIFLIKKQIKIYQEQNYKGQHFYRLLGALEKLADLRARIEG